MIKYNYIHNKLLQISKKLDLIFYKEKSFKLQKNSFNKNRIIIILSILNKIILFIIIYIILKNNYI